MPRIKDYTTSEIAVGPIPDGKATPNAFGANIGQALQDGPVAEAAAALKDISKFGGRASEGAARQLGEHSTFTAHIAGMFAHGGVQAQVAEDIIRGRREIKDNKKGAGDQLIGAGEGGTVRKFDAYVGDALSKLDAKSRAAIHEAADAYYVAKFGRRGSGAFGDGDYKTAIDAVLGASG